MSSLVRELQVSATRIRKRRIRALQEILTQIGAW
jgi:hypothetical protein